MSQGSPRKRRARPAAAGGRASTRRRGASGSPHDDDQAPFAGDCPRYVVDLDAPSEERWGHIVRAYADELPGVLGLADEMLGKWGAGAIAPLLTGAARVGFVQHGAELRGVAEAAGMSVGRVVMLQIAYEAFAACTSIVVNGADGRPLHIRTMDWEMPDLMPLTIEVDFVQGGELQYRATTWAGYVGVLTGLRPGAFSVSVNYRRTTVMNDNPIRAFATNLRRGLARHWPVSFMVREALESCTDFQSGLTALATSELIAPVYLTICGVKPGEGAILTRDREGVAGGAESILCRLEYDAAARAAVSLLSEVAVGDGALVQANMDCWRADVSGAASSSHDWQDICDSRRRRRFALLALKSLRSAPDMIDLWKLMSLAPCLAHDTVYTTSIDPGSGELVTRVAVTAAQRQAGRKQYGGIRVRNSGTSSGATRQ
jgi:hypothetical protein